MATADESYEAHLRATTLADCIARGWDLVLTCQACRRSAMLAPAERGLPAAMTLAALARAAVCSECNAQGAWIDERQNNTPRPPAALPARET